MYSYPFSVHTRTDLMPPKHRIELPGFTNVYYGIYDFKKLFTPNNTQLDTQLALSHLIKRLPEPPVLSHWPNGFFATNSCYHMQANVHNISGIQHDDDEDTTTALDNSDTASYSRFVPMPLDILAMRWLETA